MVEVWGEGEEEEVEEEEVKEEEYEEDFEVRSNKST